MRRQTINSRLQNHRLSSRFRIGGFTLVEVLIVIAIMALLSVLVVPRLIGNFAEVNLNTDQKTIVSVLRSAQERAQSGENESAWSVCFIDVPSPNADYYELRSGDCSVGVVTSTFYLNNSVVFGASQTVTFPKGSGSTSAVSAIGIRIESAGNPALSRDVCVERNGAILYNACP